MAIKVWRCTCKNTLLPYHQAISQENGEKTEAKRLLFDTRYNSGCYSVKYARINSINLTGLQSINNWCYDKRIMGYASKGL